ncbi:aminotransferase class V-fold PLP-dependent enzyme [Egicoccus halophilus]|uniref:Cysteine desulfurase n=1 Tax=Egicoccus halophilus TaxID=1670830 RepID=A0A8J3EU29_9ACTN|nr:SufS family cysteine desulfurase [Egicoccus halophilus]GGI05072.1 cysteine desulfurase [Egicoccus halophilus]
MTLDVSTLRKDFPVLSREVHDGRRLVYLDSAASSQTPTPVLEAMDRYYRWSRSNVHRGVYRLAEEATDLYEGGRTKLASFVDADPRGVVFTKNATEAMNLVAYAWVRRHVGPDDVVLTTMMEHHANHVPLLYAARDVGFEVRHVPLTDDGQLDHDAARELVADGRVTFLAMVHVSNVLGTRNDVAAMTALVRDANAECVVLVDGTQAVPQMPVSFRELDVDFYALTGHKMCGPTGIGALIAKPERLEQMDPFLTGGEMIRDVSIEAVTWNEIPAKFEAGTPMIAEAAGLGAAVDYLTGVGMEAIRDHETQLAQVFLDRLGELDGVSVHGPADATLRGGAISFAIEGVHPHDVGAMLDSKGVCVRVGHHCAKPLMKELGVVATARASLYLYNDVDDLDPLVEGIEAARSFFAR